MKSKAFILMQIEQLLDKNRGMCEEEIEKWKEENKEKTVYELLVIKKELSESKIFQDVSCMKWFREDDP
jgi:ferredoxin-fold anticodon binding domain-containing protein|tara:strand:+ start:636 stop:842 length:207 start_codon:yes stop_codon:yes gene_type:complete